MPVRTSDPERKLAVLLHADVAGSTRLVQQDEAVAHKRMTAVFRHFSTEIERYNGVVHEIRGDALVAELARASDAVAASLAFQQLNARTNLALSDGITPEVRVGISLGEVVIADDTVTGPGIVLAQRVEQLADPGGVCVTGAVYEAIPGRLPYRYDDLGMQPAKGFEEPVRMLRVTLDLGANVPAPDAPGVALRPRNRIAKLAALGVAVVALVGAGLWLAPWETQVAPARPEKMAFALPEKPSIAVLPFANLSDDPQQAYFADGMTHDLITDLSRLSSVFVSARNSSFSYKGKAVEPRQVAEELGVRYILDGSVRRIGAAVRINAQLVDVSTGGQVWAERYDGQMEDIFALQDAVLKKVVAALRVTLSEEEWRGLSHAPTTSVAAYDYWLRGMSLMRRPTRESVVQARASFQRAIEVDENFAAAYASLATTHWIDWFFQWRRGPGPLGEALVLAEQAISMDDSLALAHTVAGQVYLWQQRHEAAIVALEKAASIEPNHWLSRVWLSLVLTFSGRPKEALEPASAALRLQPRDPFLCLFATGFAHATSGQFDDAERFLRRSASSNPDFLSAHTELAYVYVELGRMADAKAQIQEARRLSPKISLAVLAKTVPFKHGDSVARRVAAWKKAGLE